MRVAHLHSWGLSSLGHKIELFHHPLVDISEPNNCILIIGGVHGDEPEGVHLAENLVDWAYG